MRRLTVMLLLVVLMSVAVAATYESMPPELAKRWLSSLTANDGWNETGYDTAGWVPVIHDLALPYPVWMTPAQQALHQFMWHPAGNNNGQPVFFRRQLWVSGHVTEAFFRVAADDQFRFFVNGQLMSQTRESGATRSFAVNQKFRAGANTLAAEARDMMGGGYGLLVLGEVTQEWPFAAEEHTWRCHLNAGSGWTQGDYDDTQWQAAVADRAPAIEVGNRHYHCFTTPENLPDYGSAYFRRDLDIDGLPVSAQVTILGDDSYQLYVNGQLVALERRMDYAYRPLTIDITSALCTGRNTLAVKITNAWGPARLYCVPLVKMVL